MDDARLLGAVAQPERGGVSLAISSSERMVKIAVQSPRPIAPPATWNM